MDRGAWWTAIHGAAKSWTWLGEWAAALYVIRMASQVNEDRRDDLVETVIKTGSLSRKKWGGLISYTVYKNLSLKSRQIKDRSMNFKPQKLTGGFPSGSAVKESACNVGVAGLILGLGRSPRGGHGNPLQCSCLENPVDRGDCRATVHGVTKIRTRLKRLSTQTQLTGDCVCYLGCNG